MLFDHPEQYGDGVSYAEEGHTAMPGLPHSVILIYLQWANVKGKAENFGDEQKKWFKRIREAASPGNLDWIFDELAEGIVSPIFKDIKKLLGDGEVLNFLHVNEDVHTPLSKLTRYWCYEDVREYVKPYEKRVYPSNKYDLSTNGWSEWISRRVNDVIDLGDTNRNVILQAQLFGGTNSMFNKNGAKGLYHGCHSWRQEISMGITLDCFYQPDKHNKRLRWAKDWQAENDKCSQKGGIFSTVDRRVLWGSYGRHSDPEEGASLYDVRDKYYDTEEKYLKLVAIKRQVDPHYIFTANMFGVDANNAPTGRQRIIHGRGYGFSGDISLNTEDE